MKEVKLLKNRKGLMEDDDFAKAVIEQVRLELADVTSEEDTTTLFGEGVTECVWN